MSNCRLPITESSNVAISLNANDIDKYFSALQVPTTICLVGQFIEAGEGKKKSLTFLTGNVMKKQCE
jgi:hypothetical protein